MKIYYDNIIYELQKAGGISTYWGELISHLLRDKKDVYFIESQHDKANNIVRQLLNISQNTLIYDRKLPKIINRFLSLKIVTHSGKFIFHSSYNRITKNPNALRVITIHDFVHERYYNGLRRVLHSYQKTKAINSADHIITVSENTKKDLLKFHPSIRSEKVSVIYNGVSDDFFDLGTISIELIKAKDKPYLLFIGSREVYKNFNFALNVMAELRDFSFYIVGAPLSTSELSKLDKNLNGRWKLFTGVSNKKLNTIYNSAYALLYPSSYEGFGIPLLEAMRAGTPFIALKKSSIPEVAGDAGILIENLDVNNFVKAIRSIDLSRQELRNKGFSQAKKFSWEKCYQETLGVYKELISQ